MHTGNTQGDSYFRLNINIENNPLCSCDNGRAGFPYAVSYAVPGCPHKHQSTGWSSLRRSMGICFARSHPVDWRVLSSFGVFCHHSCREAVLRGLTSASRQIFIRHSTVSLSCSFCNKRLDHEISMQALHCQYLQALNKCEENVIGFPRILYIPTIMTRYL